MRGARQNKGERPWPERIDQHARRARHRAVNPVSGIGIEPKMHNQRMRGRTALERVHARNRRWGLRVIAESVNRIRRTSEQLTGLQKSGCALNFVSVRAVLNSHCKEWVK